MMRAVGIFAALLVGGLPVVMLPDLRVLEAGVVVWAVCAAALLSRSLGLAVVGSIAGVLLFSASLLITSSGAILEGVVMGIAILTLLDATSFVRRFRAAGATLHVGVDHLLLMAVYVLLAVVGALAIVVVAPVLSQDLDATIRSFIVASGVVLVLGAMVRKASV